MTLANWLNIANTTAQDYRINLAMCIYAILAIGALVLAVRWLMKYEKKN